MASVVTEVAKERSQLNQQRPVPDAKNAVPPRGSVRANYKVPPLGTPDSKVQLPG